MQGEFIRLGGAFITPSVTIPTSMDFTNYLPVLLIILMAVGFAVVNIVASGLLGSKTIRRCQRILSTNLV